MFVKILRDQYGIISILEVIEKKEDINLKSGDVVKRVDDIEKYKQELEKQNTERKRYLIALSKSALEKRIQNTKININLKNIKHEHYEIINQYKANPSDALMGNLIAMHNKESWTDELICCGESKYKINKFINELQLEMGELTEART